MIDEHHRPDPDALLRQVNAEEEKVARARLKIFFGFAPGVGKTYRMLQVARDLLEQKVDVMIGVVETHGRSETAELAEGLPRIPKRKVDYQGRTLEELDLDAVLERRPKVLILDELAHTNVPGSRHAKRYQDVTELLEAGIDVYTTLNVQHVESLNDAVAQITHVQVRETVPDSVLERADEVELIDVSPEELLNRLKEGKVYLAEQAARAVEHFFRPGNLLALRELALRRTAERVDAQVLAYRALAGRAPPHPRRLSHRLGAAGALDRGLCRGLWPRADERGRSPVAGVEPALGRELGGHHRAPLQRADQRRHPVLCPQEQRHPHHHRKADPSSDQGPHPRIPAG
jgi:two-component system sensor histidine kinase KdpD